MKYFTLKKNTWQVANIYNLEKSKQINLYNFCEKNQKMILIGVGLYS